MKILQSSIFRALCAIAVGILILYKSSEMVRYIVIAIGVLFFVSGVISCLGYYNSVKNFKETKYVDENGTVRTTSRPFIPIVGVGSIFLGFILTLMPATFIKWLMYILAALLILGAINLLMALINTRKFANMHTFYWVAPILVLLAGVFIFVKPMEVASTPLIIIGVSMIVYGLSEIINTIAINRKRNEVFSNLPVPQKDGKGNKDDEYIEFEEVKD